MDRKAKLKKLNEFRRGMPHCSASALSAILTGINKHGIPEGVTDRRAFRSARDLQNTAATPYGPILQTILVFDKDDKEQHLTIAHPMAVLWIASEECESFSVFFLAKLTSTPPSLESPWHLVIYTDEVTPGNPLATNNKRKFQAFYWSFLEFGVEALCREEAWFCLTTEYSMFVNKLSGGLSQLVAAAMRCFFSDGINLKTTGMLLPYNDIRLWAVLGGVLQDGGAHKTVWHSRGDSASKFCMLCKF